MSNLVDETWSKPGFRDSGIMECYTGIIIDEKHSVLLLYNNTYFPVREMNWQFRYIASLSLSERKQILIG
jgi:hypothetical protein